MANVLAIAEQRDGALKAVSNEVVTAARTVADGIGGSVDALVIGGSGAGDAATSLGTWGADRILAAEHDDLATYHPEGYAKVIAEQAGKGDYYAILFPATSAGRDLAPRVAAKLDVPLATEITGLELDGDLAFGQLVRVQAAVALDRDTRIVFEGTRTRDVATEIRVQATLAGALGIDRMVGIHAFIGCSGVPAGNPHFRGPGTVLGAVVALLSRLADVPLRQDLALVGQLESDGRLTAVPGINERIEDAFAVAQRDSARGNAGVVIPAVQRDGLMLRPELIKAVGNDLFQVLVAGNLAQVLELLIGTSPGTWRDGRFTPDSLFDRARSRLLADST